MGRGKKEGKKDAQKVLRYFPKVLQNSGGVGSPDLSFKDRLFSSQILEYHLGSKLCICNSLKIGACDDSWLYYKARITQIIQKRFF